MNVLFIPHFIGSLVPTYLLSRLYIRIGRKIDQKNHYILANLLSLITAVILGGLGYSDAQHGFDVAAINAFINYFLPQAVWLLYDFGQEKAVEEYKKQQQEENKSTK